MHCVLIFTCWLLDLYFIPWWFGQSSYLISTRCKDIWSGV